MTTPAAGARRPATEGEGVAAGGPPGPRAGPTLAVLIAVLLVVSIGMAALYLDLRAGPVGVRGWSFATVEPHAITAAAVSPGAPWSLASAYGVESPRAEEVTLAAFAPPGCTLLPLGSATNATGVPLPAYVGGRATGLAPFWEFTFVNLSSPGGSSALIVLLPWGGAIVTALLPPGGSCSTPAGPALARAVSDSSEAVAGAYAAVSPDLLPGGPNFSEIFGVRSLYSASAGTSSTLWSVTFQGCLPGWNASRPAGTSTFVTAVLDAGNDSVLSIQNGTMDCSAPPAVALGTAEGGAPTCLAAAAGRR